MQATAPLIEAIDGFISATGMSAVTLGRKALGDPHFVKQLRGGRRVWPETEAKVRSFMAGHSADEAKAA